MSDRLHGRIALVTGAAGGIGEAIAAAFADEGAQLALTDLDLNPVQRTIDRLPRGTRASAHAADLTDTEQVQALVESVLAEHGTIEVLVNSAGLLSAAPLTEMDPSTWDEIITADLRSVFLCCRYVVPHMVRRRWGRVINITSQLGILGGERLSHYSAAKAGTIGLTKSLAREVAKENVLVNAIAPGPVETPLIESLSPGWLESKRAELPLGRFGVPAEVAPTAVLLASDPDGNLYVGQTLGPNSGDVMP